MNQENTNVIANNLKHLLKEHNMNQTELAKIAGVSQSAVGKWLLGKAVPRMGAIQKIADHFMIPKSAIIEDAERIQLTHPLPPEAITNIGVQTQRIKVYGSISAGTPIDAIENLTETTVPDQLIERYGKDNLFGLLVRGDSMDKVIHDGHYAILAKTDRVESGEVAAVICNGNDATLKRVAILEDGIVLQPSSTNPEYKSQMFIDEAAEDVRVIGKLVAVMSPPDFKF